MLRVWALLLLCTLTLGANPLQDAIDKAPSGAILKLADGVYEGNIAINKPITIIGKADGAIIDGKNQATVVTINSSFVTLKNLKIINSGERHENIDAGVVLNNASQCEISNCTIDNTLFGIDLRMVHNSIIKNNHISSKKLDLGLRGDGVRLWYSNNNIIEKNHLFKSRDMVIWYSHGNEIANNSARFCRYSLHFMYAGKNIIKNNFFEHNSVGIFFMYSKDSVATGNVIKSSLGTTGMGIGLKDVSNFTIKNNKIIYCAQGLYIDRSPYDIGSHNWIENNDILYNSQAFHFSTLSENNIIKNNIIAGNIEDIVNDRGGKIDKNNLELNYWDNYEGFDKNMDNIGDTPHKVYQYADKLWTYNSDLKFFYGSPVISMLNFLAKLAPFTTPIFLLQDTKPKIKGNATWKK